MEEYEIGGAFCMHMRADKWTQNLVQKISRKETI
jgi:hypothetical protein